MTALSEGEMLTKEQIESSRSARCECTRYVAGEYTVKGELCKMCVIHDLALSALPDRASDEGAPEAGNWVECKYGSCQFQKKCCYPDSCGPLAKQQNAIPTRERCAACQQVSPIGFWVPNELWAAVVHPYFSNSILCAQCFISRADEKLIDWSAEIKLYPVSLAVHLRDVRNIAITEEGSHVK